MTDSATEKNIPFSYKFKRCIFICTSNLFQKQILEAFNKKAKAADIQVLLTQLNDNSDRLPERFPPELLTRMDIIPFGPIPKGEHYQTIINGFLQEFIDSINRDNTAASADKKVFSDIVIENKPAVLLTLETKLYGEGIGIRTLRDNYFESSLKSLIKSTMSSWGDLRTVRLTIAARGNDVVLIPQRYIPLMDEIAPMEGKELLFP